MVAEPGRGDLGVNNIVSSIDAFLWGLVTSVKFEFWFDASVRFSKSLECGIVIVLLILREGLALAAEFLMVEAEYPREFNSGVLVKAYGAIEAT